MLVSKKLGLVKKNKKKIRAEVQKKLKVIAEQEFKYCEVATGRKFTAEERRIAYNFCLGVTKYHKIFRLPLMGLKFEEVIENVLESAGCKILQRVSRSNRRGKDLKVAGVNLGDLSAKTSMVKLTGKKGMKV